MTESLSMPVCVMDQWIYRHQQPKLLLKTVTSSLQRWRLKFKIVGSDDFVAFLNYKFFGSYSIRQTRVFSSMDKFWQPHHIQFRNEEDPITKIQLWPPGSNRHCSFQRGRNQNYDLLTGCDFHFGMISPLKKSRSLRK